jgi:small-conductance mechanosensitive channel
LGYTGYLLSLIIAVSYGGVDFTDIAIVAGALSVGIGFGLQSIINNFVSGLILLVERPFKAGDWIVVGNEEGYVKKINVRSTEVMTFNRATLTVPNSELITKTVKNWTHKGTLGRVIVSVGVSYDADPEQVRDILLKCASQHTEVRGNPEPSVVFSNFGDSALEFELRAFIVNVDRRLGVGSDLRFTIFQALKSAGIEIPFPQRDIHIKQAAISNEPSDT